VNAYNPTVLQLFRSNTDIKFIISGKAAKSVGFYITEYMTKHGLTSTNRLALLKGSLEKGEAQGVEGVLLGSASERSRLMVVRALNMLTTFRERPGVEIAAQLLGYEDFTCSHSFIS